MRHKAIPTILIAAAVVVLAAAGTVAAQGEQRFDDVPPDHYAFDAINWMVDAGITSGCGDGSSFCPDQPLNRAHVAVFLYRYHQHSTTTTTMPPMDCDSAIESAQVTIDEFTDTISDATDALVLVAGSLYGEQELANYQRLHTEANTLIETLTGPRLDAAEAACDASRFRVFRSTVADLEANWGAVRDLCRDKLAHHGINC